jgi:hypothetical protein
LGDAQGNDDSMKSPTLILCLLGLFHSISSAAILMLNPAADTYVRGGTSNPGAQNTNFGTATQLLVGSVAAGDSARSIFSFDLSSPLLTGATINSVTLTFRIDGSDASSGSSSINFNLHQLTQAYNPGQATWANASTGTPWSTYTGTPLYNGGGGVFNPTVLSSFSTVPNALVAGNNVSFGSTSNLVSLVTSSTGGTLDLLVKQSSESATRNLIRLSSLDSTDPAFRPVLTIDYTAIPEPSTYAMLLGGLALLGFLRRRKA